MIDLVKTLDEYKSLIIVVGIIVIWILWSFIRERIAMSKAKKKVRLEEEMINDKASKAVDANQDIFREYLSRAGSSSKEGKTTKSIIKELDKSFITNLAELKELKEKLENEYEKRDIQISKLSLENRESRDMIQKIESAVAVYEDIKGKMRNRGE